MKVICEKYNICCLNCSYTKFHDWDGYSNLEDNYCYLRWQNVKFLTLSDIRKKKLERLNDKI